MKNYLSYAEMYVKFMQAYEQGLEKNLDSWKLPKWA